MKKSTTLAIATAPRRTSVYWKAGEVTWGEVLEWIKEPADHRECGGYVLGVLLNRRRTNRTIVSRSGLCLDADSPEKDFRERLAAAVPYAHAAHTTYSHSPDDERFRIILPLSREVTPDEYQLLALAMMERIGYEQFDRTTVEPVRFMYKPSTQHRDWYWYTSHDGDPLPVDEILESYDPDLSRLPVPKESVSKRNPFEIEGTVGAFNRAYTVEEVIEKYDLPYEQAGDDRWHLVGAKAVAGMGPVADGLYFSHHATDPAYGRSCSVFDLVRMHRFSDLDEDSKPDTPVNRLPSHEAMLKLAAGDQRVVADLIGSDFSEEMEEKDWRLQLQLNAKSGKFQDTIDNWDLVVEHDPVFTGLYYNEMTLSVETTQDLPWRNLEPAGNVFSTVDRAALTLYLERTYKIRPSRTLVDSLVDVTAQKRWVNPVRDHLMGLVWDGKKRLERCLPGVEPTPYTRMVARKSLVAAVARMMDPGCKWDHTLVLFGSEGLGKSLWVERMSLGFLASLGPLREKDTLIAMQRAWIMLADEGHSLRKADADIQKEFLTRTADVFRMPFDREAQVHKRHSVIWSTTNDEVFLRRQEGNRRFLIVRCEKKVNFKALTPEYIDQVWAEAVHLYNQGELLYLEEHESLQAAEERELFTEEDSLAGLIEHYLETLVPEGWDDMSPQSRTQWLLDKADGLVKGTEPINAVCSAQIWVEALGRRYGDHRRTDLLDITTAMARIPGWKSLPGRHRVPGYGPQHMFVRDDEGLL